MTAFFEGSEKKFELIVHSDQPSLRERPIGFFENLVQKSQATILSQIKTSQCTAYLLSESSLFIWDNRLLMITCGSTTLIQSLTSLLQKFTNIELLIFQRKNELRSFQQTSSFEQDIQKINKTLPGQALRFGEIHSHHNLIFASDKIYKSSQEDSTHELLLYDLSPDELMTQDKNLIRNFFDLENLLPGFLIDDYAFDPYGYSLNALQDETYCTIHLTPQPESSYMSFETNITDQEQVAKIFQTLIQKLRPKAFNFLSFNGLAKIETDGYQDYSSYQQKLDCGYTVCFQHGFRSHQTHQNAFFLKDFL